MRPDYVLVLVLVAGLGVLYATARPPDDLDQLKVGLQPDGRIVVPTNQILTPAGKQVVCPGRPVDLALTDDGRTLVVKNLRSLVFIDVAKGAVKQTLTLPVKKGGFSVVGLVVNGDRVYASDAANLVRIALRQPDST